MAVKTASSKKTVTQGDVRRAQSQGDLSLARKLAERYHKAQATPESEALWLSATEARLHQLLDSGLEREARDLWQQAGQPEQLGLVRARMQALESWPGFLCRLGGPDLGEAERSVIEQVIQRDLVDLSLLEGTPLQAEALALRAAFEAVTSGPVAVGELDLGIVPRRSPLAPWKLLIRALACFYRGDEAGCLKAVEALPPESALTRLAGLLRALCGQRVDLSPEARSLHEILLSQSNRVGLALERLEVALHKERRKPTVDALRGVIKVFSAELPELLPVLRQALAVRLAQEGFSVDDLLALLDQPPRLDARFWRWLALAREPLPDCLACWEEYRRRAVAEGELKPTGPAIGRVYRRMAELAAQLFRQKRPVASALKRYIQSWRVPPAPDSYAFSASELFASACACDPSAEQFRTWVGWTRAVSANPTEAAQAWCAACPDETEPWLLQAELSEQCGRLEAAREALTRAVQLSPLDPEPGRRLVRLTMRGAWNQLRSLGKLELSGCEPHGREEKWLWHGLRWYASSGRERDESRESLADSLGGQEGALRFLGELAEQAGLRAARPWKGEPGIEALARVTRALGSVGLPSRVDQRRVGFLTEALDTVTDLDDLAAIATFTEAPELAFKATRIGLGSPPRLAEFLMLRARLHPDPERQEDLLDVARSLALKQGDARLVERVLELRRRLGLPPSSEAVFEREELVAEERALTEIPDDDDDICDCPDCRRRMAELLKMLRGASEPRRRKGK